MKNRFSINFARLATLAVFFVNGLLLANWVARIPAIQIRLGMNEGVLGLTLMGLSAGVIVALSMAGGIVGRFGSRNVTLVAGIGLCIVLPFLGLMTTPLALFVALFVFGVFLSTMDVAMNAQAVAVEQHAAKPLMSSFHAAFSIGGLAGALFGAALAAQAVDTVTHFVIASVLSLAVLLFSSRYLLDVSGEKQEGGRLISLPPRILWGLGAVAFCVAIGEGAMTDWSGVYLAQEIGTTAAFAALGFAAFSLTMTIGRLTGDWLTTRFNPVKIVRFGGLLAAVGLMAAVFTSNEYIVLLGFAAVGAGMANGIPLAFSAAGRFPGISAGAGIAGVATIGYAGFLAGPPVIGLIAEATSLRISLFLVALLLGTLVFTAQAIRPPQQEPAAAQK